MAFVVALVRARFRRCGEFRGSIIALTSITVTTGVTIDGRVLARNGAVTLDSDTITTSACA